MTLSISDLANADTNCVPKIQLIFFIIQERHSYPDAMVCLVGLKGQEINLI